MKKGIRQTIEKTESYHRERWNNIMYLVCSTLYFEVLTIDDVDWLFSDEKSKYHNSPVLRIHQIQPDKPELLNQKGNEFLFNDVGTEDVVECLTKWNNADVQYLWGFVSELILTHGITEDEVNEYLDENRGIMEILTRNTSMRELVESILGKNEHIDLEAVADWNPAFNIMNYVEYYCDVSYYKMAEWPLFIIHYLSRNYNEKELPSSDDINDELKDELKIRLKLDLKDNGFNQPTEREEEVIIEFSILLMMYQLNSYDGKDIIDYMLYQFAGVQFNEVW